LLLHEEAQPHQLAHQAGCDDARAKVVANDRPRASDERLPLLDASPLRRQQV
jgi:hypothetical protein